MRSHTVLSVSEHHSGDEGLESLICPRCGVADGLHIDRVIGGTADGSSVVLSASGEDHCARIDLATYGPGEGPDNVRAAHERLVSLRRHFFTLVGTCEHCGDTEFELVFKQHKGSTMYGQIDDNGQ